MTTSEEVDCPDDFDCSQDICEEFDKPKKLTLEYVGGGSADTTNDLKGKLVISGTNPINTNPIRIRATNKDQTFDNDAKVYFDGNVSLGDLFIVDSMNASEDDLPSDVRLSLIVDGQEQTFIKLHSSCSKPLRIGDRFGPLLLIGFEDKNFCKVPHCPVDMCPDDDQNTEPGPCGCGEQIDTDSDNIPDCIDACPLDPNIVGFSADYDANGNALPHGEEIQVTQPWSSLGIMVSTNDPNNHPLRLFDTEDIAAIQASGDYDLGTPNETFGGPGVGTGGEMGQRGENAIPLGNVIIINKDNGITNDYAGGGDVVFDFDPPRDVWATEILDVDEGKDHNIHILAMDVNNNIILDIMSDAPGNNSYELLYFNTQDEPLHDVAQIKFELPGSGSINSVLLCDPDPSCGQDGDSCDDGDACTIDDKCTDNVCAGLPLDCNDDNPCTWNDCDSNLGCLNTHEPNGTDCDNGDACTTLDKCYNGVCTGLPVDCNDYDDCTTDSCNPSIGCVNEDVSDQTPCDDGNKCTEHDVCISGECIGKPVDCDDNDPCTTDSCSPYTGCKNTSVEDHTPCDDGDACTNHDVCIYGVCKGTAIDCNDHNDCTIDTCDSSSGCKNKNVADNTLCDDGDACTDGDVCISGECKGSPVDCDDQNECTTDTCDSNTGCKNEDVAEQTPCDDGDMCIVNEVCIQGECTGEPRDCDDSNPCTIDTCDSEIGCVHTPGNQGTVCRPAVGLCDWEEVCDGVNAQCPTDMLEPSDYVCREAAGDCDIPETCTGSNPYCPDDELKPDTYVCREVAGDCDLQELCTGNSVECPTDNFKLYDYICREAVDDCDVEELCTGSSAECPNDEFAPNGTTCDDGLYCTDPDTCDGNGNCNGPARDCDDNVDCTVDRCDEMNDQCSNQPNDSFCNDGAFCNGNEVCSVTEDCILGTPVDCNDGVMCTIDVCDESTDMCVSDPEDARCDDNNVCNGIEVCDKLNDCQPGTPLDCDDNDPCTIDSCDSILGCVHTPGNQGTVCRASTGICDPEEVCDGENIGCPDDVISPNGTVCREAVDICDVEEVCDGTSVDCPINEFKPSDYICKESAGDCDSEETCSGFGATCPPDMVLPVDTVCRAKAGECDIEEVCDGVSINCPINQLQPTTTVCRESAGICDVEEKCDGYNVDCPQDQFKPNNYVCRLAVDDCDIDELCTGNSVNCPLDVPAIGGTACNDGDACTEDDLCDGNGNCKGTILDCDDGDECTEDSCDPNTGCVNSPIHSPDCCQCEGVSVLTLMYKNFYNHPSVNIVVTGNADPSIFNDVEDGDFLTVFGTPLLGPNTIKVEIFDSGENIPFNTEYIDVTCGALTHGEKLSYFLKVHKVVDKFNNPTCDDPCNFSLSIAVENSDFVTQDDLDHLIITLDSKVVQKLAGDDVNVSLYTFADDVDVVEDDIHLGTLNNVQIFQMGLASITTSADTGSDWTTILSQIQSNPTNIVLLFVAQDTTGDIGAATTIANDLKNGGTKIIVIALSDTIDVGNIQAISGPLIGKDYFILSYITLDDVLLNIHGELCCEDEKDECGVCYGDNSLCEDCQGVPNGGAQYDICGVCGGDGTDCPPPECHEDIDLDVKEKTTFEIITHDEYGIFEFKYSTCYYDDLNAVIVGFDPYVNCTARERGSCDNSLPDANSPYCDLFTVDNTQGTKWIATVDDQDMSVLYCANFTIYQLTQCRDFENMKVIDAIIPWEKYAGTLYGSVIAPKDCDNEDACEHVIISTKYNFEIWTSKEGVLSSTITTKPADLTAEWKKNIWLQSGDIIVEFNTFILTKGGDTLLWDAQIVVEDETGIPYHIINGSACHLIDDDNDPEHSICKQTWQIGTQDAEGVLDFSGLKPIKFTVYNMNVPKYDVTVTLDLTIMRTEDQVVAHIDPEAWLGLYRDHERQQLVAPMDTFIDCTHVFATVKLHNSTLPLTINEVYICVGENGDPLLYDSENPDTTGCNTPNIGIIEYTLYNRALNYTNDLFHFQFDKFGEDWESFWKFEAKALTEGKQLIEVHWETTAYVHHESNKRLVSGRSSFIPQQYPAKLYNKNRHSNLLSQLGVEHKFAVEALDDYHISYSNHCDDDCNHSSDIYTYGNSFTVTCPDYQYYDDGKCKDRVWADWSTSNSFVYLLILIVPLFLICLWLTCFHFPIHSWTNSHPVSDCNHGNGHKIVHNSRVHHTTTTTTTKSVHNNNLLYTDNRRRNFDNW